MSAPHFEVDGVTGLYKWPVLLNGDWSQWTDEPCTLLWGQANGCSRWGGDEVAFSKIGALLRAPEWPNLTAFHIGGCGFLVLAPGYSRAQAQLLAEHVNRELRAITEPPRHDHVPSEAALTWGIAKVSRQEWSLPGALRAVVEPVEQAIREMRFGSINESPSDGQNIRRDDFFICSWRDPVTELKSWQSTLALFSRHGDEPVALILGDIDHFKSVNNRYGHGSGDLHLQMLGHVLRRFESDKVAVFRLGGDEFIVWTRGYSLERAKQLAEEINTQVRALEVPILRAPEKPSLSSKLSLTWGVVGASPRNLDLPVLFHESEELLHQTKATARGMVRAKQI